MDLGYAVLGSEAMQPESQFEFDQFAEDYERMHASSVAASGEPTAYFAIYKLHCLRRLGVRGPILDFGCGIGNLTEHLVEDFQPVHAYDPSNKSIDVARRRAPQAVFHTQLEEIPQATFSTAVLSGVLHHVPPAERLELIRRVLSSLESGGSLVVFEHNPLNPLTRRAVAACPFDTGAELLWPWELRRLLSAAGLVGPALQYIVFFPHALRFLRFLEPKLRRVVMGAQVMAVARKP